MSESFLIVGAVAGLVSLLVSYKAQELTETVNSAEDKFLPFVSEIMDNMKLTYFGRDVIVIKEALCKVSWKSKFTSKELKYINNNLDSLIKRVYNSRN